MGSNAVRVAAIAALTVLVTACLVVFVIADSDRVQRLGIVIAILAPTVTGLLALARSEQNTARLNGELDLLRGVVREATREVVPAVKEAAEKIEASGFRADAREASETAREAREAGRE